MKCIVVCSGKGGTGKSCISAYTGAALAGTGHKTLMLEIGAGSRSLDLILGVSDMAYGALDVLAGLCDPSEAISPVENTPGLFAMTAGGPTAPHGTRQITNLLRCLSRDYDFVLVDGADLDIFPIAAADMFLLVMTPDTLCLRACADTSRKLFESGADEVRLIINNVPPRVIPMDGVEDFDDVIDKVGAQLIGVIPASPKLSYCANNAQHLGPDSLTHKIFENLADRLTGKRCPLLVR